MLAPLTTGHAQVRPNSETKKQTKPHQPHTEHRAVILGHADIADQSNGMIGFENRYEEAQRFKKEAKKRPAKVGEYNDYALIAIEQNKLIKARLERGFVLPFGQEVGGRFRQPFREQGLRSEENVVLKYFVTLVPRRGARASNDKATLAVQCQSKLLTLDFPYIELNRKFMAAMRVDCDTIFASPETCISMLTEIVRDGKLPCLPHIVTGDLLENGTFARPHIIWLLPQGHAVWRSEDNRCRQAPIKLFEAVVRGLVAALLEIGADPAAPSMTGRMKSPTSPFWYTLTPNCDIWPTLTEYAAWVDTGVRRDLLLRKAAAVQAKLDLSASNAIFDSLRVEGQRLLAEWHFSSDKRMAGARTALADHLYKALHSFAHNTSLAEISMRPERTGSRRDKAMRRDKEIGYVIAKVSDYLAIKFDAAKLDSRDVVRGRLSHETEGLTSVAARQAVGGRYSGKLKGISTFERLCETYDVMKAEDAKITQTALALRSGVSRGTVVKRWDQVKEFNENANRMCADSCIGKKVGASPALTYTKKTEIETLNQSATVAAQNLQIPLLVTEQENTTLLSMAVIRVRKHLGEPGTAKHIDTVIDDIARQYPDDERLQSSDVLKGIETLADIADWMEEFEKICEGRWLSGSESAELARRLAA